jgi:hypothetical protein
MEALLALAEKCRRARDWECAMQGYDSILESEAGRRGLVASADLAEVWRLRHPRM